MPRVSFYILWKHQKTRDFLIFQEGINRDQWQEVGYSPFKWIQSFISNIAVYFQIKKLYLNPETSALPPRALSMQDAWWNYDGQQIWWSFDISCKVTPKIQNYELQNQLTCVKDFHFHSILRIWPQKFPQELIFANFRKLFAISQNTLRAEW